MQTPARERLGREALPRRRRMVLAACVLASSMVFIDGTALPVALPRLRADFGADLASVQWVLNGYMLALASLTLIDGALLNGRPQTARDARARNALGHGTPRLSNACPNGISNFLGCVRS